jgi:hypothetical protein
MLKAFSLRDEKEVQFWQQYYGHQSYIARVEQSSNLMKMDNAQTESTKPLKRGVQIMKKIWKD